MTQSLLQTLSGAFPGTNTLKLARVTETMLFEQLFSSCMEKRGPLGILPERKMHLGTVFYRLHAGWSAFTEIILSKG